MKDLPLSIFLTAAVLMLMAGVGIPVMAAMNAGLSRHIQSPLAASTILVLIASAICVPLMLMTGTAPGRGAMASTPLVYYFGAFFFLLYIFSVTWAAPRIGLGNAVFFVLLGQLISATIIDHYGLFGAIKAEVDMKRIAGLVIMAIGVYFARRTA